MHLQNDYQVITDEERMRKDFWDLGEFSEWDTPENKGSLKNKGISTIMDFYDIKNPKIRQEIKSFYRHNIVSHKRKLKTICTMMYRERRMWEFINSLSLRETLLEISEEMLVAQYRRFLMSNTKWNMVSVFKQLDANQKPKYYVEDADCVNSIKQLYHYLESEQLNIIPERKKDIWDIRHLPIYVEQQKSRARHMINFSRIPQPIIRETIKTYIFERLKVRKLSCVFEDMKALNFFTRFLDKYHPNIQAISQLTRQIVDEYMFFLNKQDIVMTTKRARAGYLRTFFKLVGFLEICEMPDEILIPDGNLYKRVRTDYQIIPDNAMQELNAHLGELPSEIRMVTLILEYVGMRINECCQLGIECLKYDSEGGPFLEYFQGKTSHMNRVPISKFLENEIQSQQIAIREKYPNSLYLLTTDGINPISQESFSFHVNRLAYKYQIKDENGNLFRFKSHQFRHTLATKYALEGMSPNMIREMLGHHDLKSIHHYIQMRDTIMSDQLQAFLQHEDEQYEELRRLRPFEQEKAIPLSYGYCSKVDLCETALACYACGMFHMGKIDWKTNSAYLQVLQKKIEEAEKMGWDRQLEMYEKMVEIIGRAMEDRDEGKKQ